jgi:hypothetical protein
MERLPGVDRKRVIAALRTALVVVGLIVAGTGVCSAAIRANAKPTSSGQCPIITCGDNHNQVLV